MEKLERNRLRVHTPAGRGKYHSRNSDEQSIQNCLMDIRARMHRQTLLQTVVSAVFFGLLVLATLFIAARIIHLPIQLFRMTCLVIFGAIVVGICFSFKRRKDLRFVARTVDRDMGLKERLSTAFELIQDETQSGLARFQIRDAAATVATLAVAKVSPYRMPLLLKGFPVPILFIALSFAIPRFYHLPQLLTAAQQEVVDIAVANLEKVQVNNQTLQAQIQETVKKLKEAEDVDTAQAHLSSLNRDVRKQKLEQMAAIESAITKATQATQRFGGMDANQLAAELEAVMEQPEMPPELQAELAELFARLTERLPQDSLGDSLTQIQGKAVSQETLQDIVDVLRQAEKSMQLAQLEAQLTASRKELALAGIEIQQASRGIANSDGAPGQNRGDSEVQGTLEAASDFASHPTTSTADEAEGDMTIEGDNFIDSEQPPLTGETTSPLQVGGTQLTLTTEPSLDSQRFSRVFTGEGQAQGTAPTDAPAYLPFSHVVLNAKRAYAQAMNNNRIPVRYQTQMKAYLEAIATVNEKQGD